MEFQDEDRGYQGHCQEHCQEHCQDFEEDFAPAGHYLVAGDFAGDFAGALRWFIITISG